MGLYGVAHPVDGWLGKEREGKGSARYLNNGHPTPTAVHLLENAVNSVFTFSKGGGFFRNPPESENRIGGTCTRVEVNSFSAHAHVTSMNNNFFHLSSVSM